MALISVYGGDDPGGAMVVQGRKLLPKEEARHPLDRFAWLVRTIRACDPDPDVRRTATFANRLSSFYQSTLQPATINKLETGAQPFSIEKCISYELALGLEPYTLTDPFIWLARLSGVSPLTSQFGSAEVKSSDIELFADLAAGARLSPLSWLRLSLLYMKRREFFHDSPRLRALLIEGLMIGVGEATEGAERLMREALINIGSDAIPYMVEGIRRDPSVYFVAAEALGYIPGPESWSCLVNLLDQIEDSVLAPAIIEQSMNKLKEGSESDAMRVIRALQAQSISVLQRTDELFIAREAAWALVSAYNMNLTHRQRLIIHDLREDIIQLLVQPTTCQRKDILADVESNFRSRLNGSPGQIPGIPLTVPGLRAVIAGGIFSTSRVWRFTTGIILSPWQRSEHVAGALADTLMKVPTKDYGLQRSIVRLITKVGSRGLLAAGRGLTSISTSDDSVRLSLAWALGEGSGPGDEKILSDLYDNSHDRITKRAICVAARRRQFARLIQRFSQDSDSAVSSEARIALAALRELIPRNHGLD